MNSIKPSSLDLLFKPKTIAIYTASEKLYYFINGFIEFRFDLDNLYLISSKDEELFGIKCYKSLDDIPEEIDLCIMAVRRDLLVQSLNEVLNKKKVKFIHFFTAGTAETDDKGLKIETQLIEIMRNHNHTTRAIGPNCMGVYCPNGKNTYAPTFPKESGNISLIFHSGDLHSKMLIYSSLKYRLKFSKGVSVGNCVDLQISDFLIYFNQDKETDIICIYFEGFSRFRKSEGKRLLNALKNMEKPVLFLRGGRTQRAQTAVLTHTGSLGTGEKIWDALFKQTTTINAGTILDDLIDNTYLFNEFFKKYKNLIFTEKIPKYPKGRNALVILWSGGLGIIDTDELTDLGINLPYFEGETIEKLRKIYPLTIGSLSNPLDLPWIASDQIFADISKAAVSENIDFVILETDAPLHWDAQKFQIYWNNLIQIKDYVNSLDKIFIIILPQYPHRNQRRYTKMLLDEGFIIYPSVRRAAKAFLSLFEYGRKMKAKK
jgi:acetyltransferase